MSEDAKYLNVTSMRKAERVMELVSKDEVMKIIKAGCKLNSIINILVKDMVEKVEALPTVIIEEKEK